MSHNANKAMERRYGKDWRKIWFLRNKNLSLSILPTDIFELITQKLLKIEPQATIYFSQVSKAKYTYLQKYRSEAELHMGRVFWVKEPKPRLDKFLFTPKILITQNGLKLTADSSSQPKKVLKSYIFVMGSILPKVARVSFTVKINRPKSWCYPDTFIGVVSDHYSKLSLGFYPWRKKYQKKYQSTISNYNLDLVNSFLIEVILNFSKDVLSFRVNEGPEILHQSCLVCPLNTLNLRPCVNLGYLMDITFTSQNY